jgi:flagellar basal-body rod modification protein FlgD
MSTSPVVPTPPAGGTTAPTSNGLPSGQTLNNMFLQLLVAQLQHQDPTSPVDPSQFVGQLAQFSELSEVTSIYQLMQQLVPAPGGSGSGSGSGGGTSPAPGNSAAGVTASPAGAAASSLSSQAGSAVGSAPAAATNFASPALSTLISKIQGVF